MRASRAAWAALVAAALVTLGCGAAAARGEGDAGGGGTDWPMFHGQGNRTPPRQGLKLVEDFQAARKAWELERHMTVAKGLYPGTLQAARSMGIEPFYGGASSPIVADGTVFVTYYKPDGKVPAKVEPWRTVGDPASLLPKWFFSVTADDILVAVDARTGEVKWEAVEKGKGLNRLGHKRGHWCVSPAYAQGRVFSMGSAGRLYAYDARTGRKLWETLARAELEALRKEYLEKRTLCWEGREGSSLVAVEGVVVVPHGRLAAFDAETGEARWRTEERVESGHSTPTFWRDGGRTYLVTHTGSGALGLVDPSDGRVLWTMGGLEPFLGTLSVSGDIVITNVGSAEGNGKRKPGLFGAVRLTPEGGQRLWTLPDKERYRHGWWLDRGAEKMVAVGEDKVWIAVGGAGSNVLVVADLETGKILSEQETGRGNRFPYLFEERLLVYHDRAHTDPITAAWWTAEVKARELNREVAFDFVGITGYEVPIQWPFVDGFLYCRSLKGMVCYDLRKPGPEEKARVVNLVIRAALAGRREDVEVMLYERGGRLTHGGWRGSRMIHAVDVGGVEWDGRKLKGTLEIDLVGQRRAEAYEVDATVGSDGRLSGTVETGEEAFEEPVALSGPVTAMERQAAWMPECTHVLNLEGGSCRADGGRERLLLFVTVEGDRLVRVEGFADNTTTARPLVDAEGLRLEEGRLRGAVAVRYRGDEWTTPLVEHGASAAARYELDCRVVKTGEAGSYTGTYGAAWRKSGRLAGHVEAQACGK